MGFNSALYGESGEFPGHALANMTRTFWALQDRLIYCSNQQGPLQLALADALEANDLAEIFAAQRALYLMTEARNKTWVALDKCARAIDADGCEMGMDGEVVNVGPGGRGNLVPNLDDPMVGWGVGRLVHPGWQQAAARDIARDSREGYGMGFGPADLR